MNRFLPVFIGLLGCALNAFAAEVFYKNPVIAGDHPDPSIIRTGKDYWATCTSSAWGPLFPLLHSTDLVNWEQTGSVLTKRPDWATGDFWAPEISEFNGKFLVYFTARQRNGRLSVAVATANKPTGPYTDHGPLVAQEDGSIDPSTATDRNGVRYLIWKEDGNSRNQPSIIWAQKLNDDGTKLVGEMHELIRNDIGWEGGVVEGPFVLRRGDWFYLFYSGNGCCGSGCTYALGVARSHSLLGPWEKNPANPILAGNETWSCPGHGSIVQTEVEKYFLLYHAYSTKGTVFTGREGMLDEVKFGANDWPTINNGNGASVKTISPLGATQKVLGASYAEDFSQKKIQSGWQWPQHREPIHRLENGKLFLAASGRETNLLAAVLARSTLSLDYAATATFATKSLKPGTAVGLCAFGDSDNAMGVAFQDGEIITWRRDRGATREVSRQPAPAAPKLLLQLTTRLGYRFQFAVSADGERWQPCSATDAKDLPPWDRSVRVALTVGGAAGAEGIFDSFAIKPLETSTRK